MTSVRLSILIPLLLILSSLVSGILLFTQEIRVATRNIEHAAVDSLDVTLTQLQSMLNTQLAGGSLEDAKLSLAVSALHPGIRVLLLADEDNKVLLANRYIWERRVAGEVSGYAGSTARQVRQTQAGSVSLDASLLSGYYPVTLEIVAGGLGKNRVGVLFVEYDLSLQLAQARHNAVVQAVSFGGLMIAVSVVVAMLLHFLVSRRLKKVVEAVQRFAGGDLDTRVHLHGRDELAELGHAFDHMAGQSKEAQEKLRLANVYNRSLIEASLDPLVTISAQGKITDVNLATEKVTGRSRAELIGTDFSDYFTAPDKARAGYRQVFAQGYVTDYPLALRHRDGHVTDVLYNASIYCDEAGEVLGVFAAARDITERKRAEALRTQLAAIVESSSDAIIGKTTDGIITSWNKAAENIYGYSAGEIIGKHVTVLASPPGHAEIQEVLETVRRGGAVANHESERLRKDGTPIHVALTLSPIRDAAGVITGISTITRDITEKKRMEERLRQANVYNRSLIEASLDPLVTISAEGKITDVNQATENVTGRSRAELVGTDFSNYFTEPDRARAGYRQVFDRGSVTDYPLALRHRDGHVTDVLYNASIYRDEAGEVLGVFAAARDVTERKKAEQEVAQLSVQNKLILDSAGEGIYGLGLDGRCTFVNPSAVQLLGFSAEELVGEHAHYKFHHTKPDGRSYPEEECPVQAAYRQGEVHRGDDLYWRKDGSSFPVEFISTPILDAGEITGAVVTFRDITERKVAEEKLRSSEHSLSEAQRIAHLGNWELDLVHNVLSWSDEIFRIFEIDPQKFGASYEAFLNAIHPDDRDMVNKAYTDSVANKVPYDIVHRLRMQDGRIKYVNEMCETYYGEDGKPLRSVGTVHDITERKLAEDEVKALNRDLEQRVIMRTAELEAANKELEAFAYSVSHDLRTPLRAIDGFSRIVLDDYRDKLDDEGKRLLNVVRDNTIRMGQLIDDILKFSRAGRTEIAYAEIDMEKMARTVFDELQPGVAADKLQLEIGHLPPARGDSAMMRQVFVNLLSNAIKFSRAKEPARITVGGSIEGGEAVYFVRDNGAGFDMQYAGRLFGVFQRLHDVNEFEGTGIGLAIVKRIITRHGGRVWAEGKVNEGATIHFALPARDEEHA